MPIKEIMILRKGGMPLYNFAPEGAPKLDALVAGFLSAQAGFAEEIGEGEIQILSFAENKFVYESRADLLFIVVIALEDDENIFRVILKEIAQAFEKKYRQILAKTVIPSHLFSDFRGKLMEILTKYERIPQVEARYPTAILPPEKIKEIEQLLHKVESHPGFIRAAIITDDGYIVSSKLHSHELELVIKQIEQAQNLELPMYFAVSQAALEEGTKLFIHLINGDIRLFAIVRKDPQVTLLAESIAGIINQFNSLDLSSMVKVLPKTQLKETFFDFEVFASNPLLESTLFAEGTPQSREFQRLFGDSGIQILQTVDGVASLGELRTRSGVHSRKLTEILNFLLSRGYIRRVQFYPKLAKSDARFTSYLETVGLPRDEFQILEQAKHFCTGDNSIQDIALRIGVEYEKLVKVLRKMGEYVEWLT